VTLRTRLLIAAGVILALLALGAVTLLESQQSFLVDQVDDELREASPLVRYSRPRPTDPPVEPPLPGEAPISRLFIGYVEDGELVTVLQGQLLDDVPALDLDAAALREAIADAPFTVDGQTAATRFRVAVLAGTGSEEARVVGLPLDEVDSAIGRLRWALGGGTLAVTAILLLAIWWVQRLGLRPIARLTAVADAITRGARGHRVVSAAPHTEAGKLADAFNVMLDQRDATEERLRQFIADASHELRTPLTSIRGYLDLYREGGFRSEGQLDDMIRRMRQESSRMHDLVEDLLLLAQLDQHRPLRREDVDVGQLLRDAATDAQVLQPDRPIALDVPDEPIESVGDAYRLQQVVGAIVANALAHTEMEVDLHLAARATADGAEITITDTGPGLQPEDAARVFDRFFRRDHSRARRTGGSGLGLAIAKSIVEAHHGTITLRTAPGAGCRFVITLPHHTIEPTRDPSVPSAVPAAPGVTRLGSSVVARAAMRARLFGRSRRA
jgi:two-component system OmpR family sensor kinase